MGIAAARRAFSESLGTAGACASLTMTWTKGKPQKQKFTAIVHKPDGECVEVVGKYHAMADPIDCVIKMGKALITGEELTEVELRVINVNEG